MPNNMVLLETIALTQSAASVTFDNLPTSGYTDLKIVMSTRTSDTTVNDSSAVAIQFNGDTGSNYTRRSLYGDGGAAGSSSATTTSMRVGFTTTNGDTANTYGNGEFYIPNYRGSTQKSVSADAVTEANVAQYIYAAFNAGLWTGTAAITSITVIAPSFSFLAGSTFSLYGIAALGTTPVTAPKATGGNIVANDGTYWYHAFTSSGYFVPQVGLTADVLVIAGGGGGGNNRGGGGGAGGVLSFSSQALANGTNYSCTVGAGGPGAPAGTNTGGTIGVDSQFGALTLVKGGGYGGGIVTLKNGSTGGSGGGGGGNDGTGIGTGGSNTSGQGNIGGNGNGNSAGGGGGSGAAGQTAPSTSSGGTGGAGLNTWSTWATATNTGVSGFFAGGGGGGSYPSGTVAGGSGGAGTGGSSSVTATAAIANTGSGGGGSGETGAGGAGGSGIIIVRYPIN